VAAEGPGAIPNTLRRKPAAVNWIKHKLPTKFLRAMAAKASYRSLWRVGLLQGLDP
jgi:hypothetical protein